MAHVLASLRPSSRARRRLGSQRGQTTAEWLMLGAVLLLFAVALTRPARPLLERFLHVLVEWIACVAP